MNKKQITKRIMAAVLSLSIVAMQTQYINFPIYAESIGDSPIDVLNTDKDAKLVLSCVNTDESGNARMSLNAETEAGVTNGMFTITYDATKLKLETAEAGEALAGAMTEINTKTDGKIVVGFMSTAPIKSTGSYIDLNFKSLGTDETGREISIKTEAVSGKVTIETKGEQKPPFIENDINGDGIVGLADLLKLKKYILGYEKLTSDALIRADLNKNGTVDIFDLQRMKQLFLA